MGLARFRRGGRVDNGFALVEVLVATVVFGLLASAVLYTLVQALSTTRGNRMRVVAANVANRQIEIARGMSVLDIPVGLSTSTLQVDNTTFTIRQDANWVPSSSATSSCDAPSGSRLGYKRVTVTVTWPNMGGIDPVRSDTIKTAGVSGIDPSKGNISVAVQDRDGRPLAGQQVRLTPGGVSQITGADGCAVFTGLSTAVSYTASVDTPGFVDLDGNQRSVTAPVTPAPAVVTKAPVLRYDRAASVAVRFDVPTGYRLPDGPGLPVTVAADPSDATTTRSTADCAASYAIAGACLTGQPRLVPGLFPVSQGYVSWAGDCASSRPATLPAPIPVAPGAVAVPATVPLVPLDVVARDGRGTFLAVPVYAVPAATSGCPVGEAYRLGTTSGSEEPLRMVLPPGDWVIQTAAATGSPPAGGFWPTVGLVPGSSPVLAEVVTGP
jgi:prepilin-type N-terminal cleavage/methylation domain-containing protein